MKKKINRCQYCNHRLKGLPNPFKGIVTCPHCGSEAIWVINKDETACYGRTYLAGMYRK
ncbi:MAG: hypothetical protein ABIA75_14025 [Candidatus Neomarinimicrobiota bacterium]